MIRLSSIVDLVDLSRRIGKFRLCLELSEPVTARCTHSDLPVPDIPALDSEVLHPPQRELSQVSILDSTRDERHRDVSLDPVDSRPWRDEGHDPRDDVHERVRRVVLVLSGLPELVQTGTSDDERRVQLQSVRTVGGILEVLLWEEVAGRTGSEGRERARSEI